MIFCPKRRNCEIHYPYENVERCQLAIGRHITIFPPNYEYFVQRAPATIKKAKVTKKAEKGKKKKSKKADSSSEDEEEERDSDEEEDSYKEEEEEEEEEKKQVRLIADSIKPQCVVFFLNSFSLQEFWFQFQKEEDSSSALSSDDDKEKREKDEKQKTKEKKVRKWK